MTLNQAVHKVGGLFNSHPMLKTVRLDIPSSERRTNYDNIYPAAFFTTLPGSVQGKEVTYKFQVWVLDRLTKERDNELEVQSDMGNIAFDFIAMLKDPRFDWQLQDGITISYVVDSDPDLIAGVTFEVGLKLAFRYDRCSIPKNYAGRIFDETFNAVFN